MWSRRLSRWLVLGLVLPALAVPAAAQTTTGLIEVAWDAVVVADLAGYRLYVHTDPNIFALAPASAAPLAARLVNLSSATTGQIVTGLDATRTWFFAVTAIDASGNESGFSNVASGQPSVTPTVRSVTPASATQGDANVAVTISGGNFLGTSTVDFGPGIVVNSVNAAGAPATLVANISVDLLASATSRTVSVQNPGGATGTKAAAFAVAVRVARLDIDGSGRIDNGDFVNILLGFPSLAGDAQYSTTRDLDVDGKIDGADLAILFSFFGLVAPFP